MSIRKYTQDEASNIQLGQAGWDIVTNATVNAHTYVAITVLVGTEVIADNTASGTVSATSVNTDLGDTLSTLEIPVGCTIYGRWSAITVGANDTAIVYRG
tara:strand:- start:964 stop:1263 length:300 start_codon:yes stop_codon:yes gene_type:complete